MAAKPAKRRISLMFDPNGLNSSSRKLASSISTTPIKGRLELPSRAEITRTCQRESRISRGNMAARRMAKKTMNRAMATHWRMSAKDSVRILVAKGGKGVQIVQILGIINQDVTPETVFCQALSLRFFSTSSALKSHSSLGSL